ncbi:MAG TPA: nuclear transport factor 2 family protein [Thermoleophilaceae bacterium]
MLADNVQRLRRYYELLNDTGEPVLEFVHPQIEIHMFEGAPLAGPYHGHDGVRQWRRDTFDVIDAWRVEIDEVITGEDLDTVVVLQRFVGRMKHTDLPVNFPLAVVVRFRDGLITRFDGYRELDEALTAAVMR